MHSFRAIDQAETHVALEHDYTVEYACKATQTTGQPCLHTGVAVANSKVARAPHHTTSKIATNVAFPFESEAAYLWRGW